MSLDFGISTTIITKNKYDFTLTNAVFMIKCR